MTALTFRQAAPEDTGLVLHFIRLIAEYENMSDEVVATEASLHKWMFEKKMVEVVFAVLDGREIGFALFFHNFSTFVGKAGLYLEDIYILKEHRGHGYGKAIFREVAKIAAERGCSRLEWQCLDWNQPSIDFYRSMGARPMTDWTTYRLTDDGIRALAEG